MRIRSDLFALFLIRLGLVFSILAPSVLAMEQACEPDSSPAEEIIRRTESSVAKVSQATEAQTEEVVCANGDRTIRWHGSKPYRLAFVGRSGDWQAFSATQLGLSPGNPTKAAASPLISREYSELDGQWKSKSLFGGSFEFSNMAPVSQPASISGSESKGFTVLIREPDWSGTFSFKPEQCRKERVDASLLDPNKANRDPKVITISGRGGSGTAFFYRIGGDTFLVTDSHVLKGQTPREVKYAATGQRIPAEWQIEYDNPDLDLVFLRVPKGLAVPRDALVHDVRLPFLPDDARIAAARGIIHPVPIKSVTEKALTLLGVAEKGTSGSPVLDGQGRFLGVYQQLQYAGVESYVLPAQKVRELLLERPISQTQWNEKGQREILLSGKRIAEHGVDFVASAAEGGTGDGGAEGGTGDGGDGHSKGEKAYLTVQVESYRDEYGRKRKVDSKLLLPLRDFESTYSVDGKSLSVPPMPEYQRFFETAAALDHPPTRPSFSNQITRASVSQVTEGTLARQGYAALALDSGADQASIRTKLPGAGLMSVRLGPKGGNARVTLGGKTIELTSRSSALTQVLSSADKKWLMCVRANPWSGHASILFYSAAGSNGPIWLIEN